MLPQRLILIRHGQSEGNLIVHNTRDDDDSLYQESMINDHTVSWRLSKKGVKQAKQLGKWLKENTFLGDRSPWNDQLVRQDYYVSDYVRAIETAYELNLENPKWIITPEVRERMYGDMDFLIRKPVFDKKFERNIQQQKASRFHWVPPNGEALPSTCERAANFSHRILDTNVVRDVAITCHGEFIWGLRIAYGEITRYDYEELHDTKPIYNCQVTEFSHLDSQGNYTKVRHYCPSAPDYHDWKYKKIERKVCTNNDLLKIIKKYPRLIKY